MELSQFNDLNRVEFSKINSLLQFPIRTTPANAKFLSKCTLILPSTLKKIDLGYQERNIKKYIIYATKGSFAEQWAKENNIEFVELNSETAVYTDIRESCNKYTQTLFFDALGFNKQYQWYGSLDGTTDNAVALAGATKELINLHDYKSYPYYFCKCISTDICEEDDFKHEEIIYSTLCKNEDYAPADYSEYNDAVEKANALDFSIYVDTGELEQALLVDVSNLSSNEQNIIDAQTEKILKAIGSLVLKEPVTEPSTEPKTEPTKPVVEPENSTTQPSTKATTTSLSTSERNILNKNTSLTSPNTGNSTADLGMVSCIIAVVFLLSKTNKRRE